MRLDDEQVRGGVGDDPEHRHCHEWSSVYLLVRSLEILAQPEPRDVVMRRQAVVDARERRQRREDANDGEGGDAMDQTAQAIVMIHPRLEPIFDMVSFHFGR